MITDFDTGLWSFDTIKPGATSHPDGRRAAPHITLWIVARGINVGLQTRLYFEDEDNTADPVLTLIEQTHRRDTLLARKLTEGHYRFDSRLQREAETVFLDV